MYVATSCQACRWMAGERCRDMVELKSGVQARELLQQMTQLRQQLANSQSAFDALDGQRYFLTSLEAIESTLSHSFDGQDWYDQLYSPGYWAIRAMTPTTTRPMPLLRSESDRILRWLDDIEVELNRIAQQDEWDDKNIPRIVLDTSAIVREGEFDTFNWEPIVKNVCVRIILPILVIRELDNLKNSGKEPKARKRLRRIYEVLGGHGRGWAPIRPGVTLELLMNPPRHVPLAINDEEIIRRAQYLKGRVGGPLTLISGDYRMVLSAQAEGLDAQLTPAELKEPVE